MSFGPASLSTDADRCRNAEAIPVKDRIRQPITNYHEVHRTQWVLPLLCTSLVRYGRRFPGMKNPPVLQRAGPLPLREIDLSASSQSCSLIIRDHRGLHDLTPGGNLDEASRKGTRGYAKAWILKL